MKRLVFDIETEPFTQNFREASTESMRKKYAPIMRVACVFDESRNEYRYYTPENAISLVDELLNASEVISFNGKNFDLHVLRKHYGLKGRVPKKGAHIDIHLIMTEHAGFRVSLDKAARINFGEKKHTDGRSMDALTLDELKAACKSDVSQTYRLWLAYEKGKLLVPRKTKRERVDIEEYGDIGPGHHMPRECPHCHDVGSLHFIEWETDGMSEGQWIDYISGLYGSAMCHTCGHEIDFGF